MVKYKKGNIVKGCITGMAPYGAFVSLDEYYDGLIHISEISNKFVSNIEEIFNVGDTIYAIVLEVDDDLFKVKLSIKNIDYKVDGKRVRKPIKENGLGFQLLDDNIGSFIALKINEIDKNE